MTICDKCGFINENDDLMICSKCNSSIDKDVLNNLLPFARNAVYYGYYYRIDYERQVKEDGDVKVKYSLITPSNYWELLAAFALSGYIGGVSLKLVNYIGQQLLDIIKKKVVHDKNDEEIVQLINNKDELQRFTKYIIDYYHADYGEEKVANAVIEEEIADLASDEKQDVFLDFMKGFSEDKKEEFLDLFKKLAEGVAERRRKLKPDKDLLRDVFKITKKMLKNESKKESKKNRKKK